MKNIVITAGGTVENIDEVRKITNTSTGKLASLIGVEIIKFLEQDDFMIHYIISSKAIRSEVISEKIRYYEVTDTQSVIDAIDVIFDNNKIDYFIHSMAVSDFTTSYTIETDTLASEISNMIRHTSSDNIEGKIKKILEKPSKTIKKGQKISSQKDIMVALTRTPKVISLIKKYDKDVCLVGFKLLNDVSQDRLIEVATKLGKDNKCDFVLANDMKDIDAYNHKAILLKDGTVIKSYNTKLEIAKGIVEQLFRSERR